jgi:hypothetical protein
MIDEILENRIKRLERLNSIVLQFDPSVRAEAFKSLLPYVVDDKVPGTGQSEASRPERQEGVAGDGGRETFFAAHAAGKPADNVLLICAYLYGEYGNISVTHTEITEIAGEVGITVPTRVDKTLAQARRDAKALFRAEGGGSFKPTVHGELFFQQQYGLKKGRKAKATDGQ